MDPLRLGLALGPLALYLLVLGWINLSRRPVLISGGRDTLALGLALVGLVLVGPIELFMPLDAASIMGAFVWVLLLSLYGLVVTFVLLTERPRLVVYNITPEVLRPLLADAAARLDSNARWAGDSLAIPALNIELRLEITRPTQSIVLAANNERQSAAGWRLLASTLASDLRQVEVAPNLQGLSMITFAIFAIGLVLYSAASDPAGMAQNFFEMLRF